MGNVKGLAEVVLLVGDVEASLHFYRDVLGLKVISPDWGAGAPAFLQVGDDSQGVPMQIVIVPAPAAAGDGNQRLHHIGLELEAGALEAEKARLTGLGFEVRTGEHPFLPVDAVYIDDPDGNEIELVVRR